MNFGFNSNVRTVDALYHVQTEDRGPSHPYLDTVVYEAGRVVYKRSTNYADFAKTAGSKGVEKQLHERLAQQHHEVIAELEAGTLALNSQAPAHFKTDHVPAGDGLDVRLKNPKSWFESGRASLEIELRRHNSGEEVGNADIEILLEHERDRTSCVRGSTDATGLATLKFSMPATIKEGASLVIRATDGAVYGELRFRLKVKPRDPTPASAPVSK
jgi:hypothetical protein